MLRHACGYKLANDGTDTRTIQAYLGHRSYEGFGVKGPGLLQLLIGQLQFRPNKQAFLSLIFTHNAPLAGSCVSTACL
jgi:hypothetical protein